MTKKEIEQLHERCPTIRDYTLKRGGIDDGIVLLYDGFYVVGIDYEAEVLMILDDEGLDTYFLGAVEDKNFDVYRQVER